MLIKKRKVKLILWLDSKCGLELFGQLKKTEMVEQGGWGWQTLNSAWQKSKEKLTVSVCQKVSTMAHLLLPTTLQYQSQASGLIGSPTLPSTFKELRSYLQEKKQQQQK